MTATMLPADWLRFVGSEYVDGFVRDGGSAVKFVVPMDDECRPAAETLARQAAERGYVVAQLDASEIRVHLVQELFFRIAQQVPWQEVADRAVLRLARERGMAAPPPGPTSMFERIVEQNQLDPDTFARDLQPLLGEFIVRERTLASDFRIAMTHLCLGNLRRGASDDQRRAVIIAWLTGEIRTVGPLKDYQILSPINRTNARHHFHSMLRFLRFVGFPGLVVTIDVARLAVPSNPKDGSVFYRRDALLDFYESLREFIDETDRLEGCLLLILPAMEFLDDAPTGRGSGAYQALKFRIYDEVHDVKYVNPMASLIRLSMHSPEAPLRPPAAVATIPTGPILPLAAPIQSSPRSDETSA